MFIDLSAGYDAYAEQKRNAIGFDRLARKARKLEREVGPLRFELHTPDRALLDTLMQWRLARYAQDGYHDLFAIPWAREVILNVHATQTTHFGGVLSALYAGGHVAAAHMGIRWHDVWHSWFIAYAPRFARYSPGLILYLMMAQQASAAGLRTIELGGGEFPYKRALMNRSIPVAGGAVDRLTAMAAARRWCEAGANVIRGSALLRPPARAAIRTYRRIKHHLLYEHAG
jgi:CelD/BcsL family acetyltransferase involved in cellulose biosynthesis